MRYHAMEATLDARRYGSYELVCPLATGGMAELFLARRVGVAGFSREVAIKRLLPEIAAEASSVRMFLDEARIASLLQHPNIVQVLDLGRVDETYFIAMEFVDGLDLWNLHARGVDVARPLPLDLATWVVARAAEGLHHAHGLEDPVSGEALHLVHRDVAPDNILLSIHGDVKVADFGLARARNRAETTRTGIIKGKPGYLSPEQITGVDLDHRADIFGLGVVLYELLARTRLYLGLSRHAVMRRIVHEQPEPPSAANPSVPPILDRIVMQALRKPAAERQITAGALAQELDVWLQEVKSDAGPAMLARWIRDEASDLCPSARLDRRLRTGRGGGRGAASGNRPPSSGGRRQAAPSPSPQRSSPAVRRPSSSTITAATDNLPRAVDTFVGRQAELATIEQHFDGGARLVTVIGTAGIGKSRVALEYARRQAPQRAAQGGVWRCALGEVDGVEAATGAVATELGVPLVGASDGRQAIEQLGVALSGRPPMLLLLDDFDLLVSDAEAMIGTWLDRAPELRLLVTSRSRLRLEGEVAIEVEPLALPGRRRSVADSEAVELFVERARGVRAGWRPTAQELKTVARIARQLEGIPLAIELAASRMAVLSPSGLLSRLSRRFEVLRGGRQKRGRMATLRDAIEWSWTQLSAWEQDALCQVAVFRGGFSIEAAEAIVDLSGHAESPAVIDAIEGLRDRSMLRVAELRDQDGELRFGLFESIRVFGAGKADVATLVAASGRHGDWYVAQAEMWSDQLASHHGLAARRSLAMELDNLRAVHARALAGRPAPASGIKTALRIAVALLPLLTERGPMATAARLLDEALAAAEGRDVERATLASALSARAELRARMGRVEPGLADAQAAIEIARDTGDPAAEALALCRLGYVHRVAGDPQRAIEAAARSAQMARQQGNLVLEMRDLNLIGCAHYDAGRRDVGSRCIRAAAAAARQLGDQVAVAMTLGNVGLHHADRGEHDAAEALFHEALDLATRQGDRLGAAIHRTRLGLARLERGDLQAGRSLLERGVKMLREVGASFRLAYSEGLLAWHMLESGDFDIAGGHLDDALRCFEEIGERRLRAMFLGSRAVVFMHQGDARAAEQALSQAKEIAASQADPLAGLIVRLFRGSCEALRGHRAGGATGRALIGRAEQRLLEATTPPKPEGDDAGPGEAPAADSSELRAAMRVLATCIQPLAPARA